MAVKKLTKEQIRNKDIAGFISKMLYDQGKMNTTNIRYSVNYFYSNKYGITMTVPKTESLYLVIDAVLEAMVRKGYVVEESPKYFTLTPKGKERYELYLAEEDVTNYFFHTHRKELGFFFNGFNFGEKTPHHISLAYMEEVIDTRKEAQFYREALEVLLRRNVLTEVEINDEVFYASTDMMSPVANAFVSRCEIENEKHA